MNRFLHHPALLKLRPWEGIVNKGISVDFLGIQYDRSFINSDSEFGLAPANTVGGTVRTCYPSFNEEYFEWIDLLEAVTAAKDRFTMIELGAGFGRWLVRGAFAVRALNDLPYYLIGVEAEPQHYRWMTQHFAMNGIDRSRHLLVNSPVSGSDEEVWFVVGDSAGAYGQNIVARSHLGAALKLARLRLRTRDSRYSVRKMRARALVGFLETVDIVDLIDFDIQGEELKVVASARSELDSKVKRVHIGTHYGVEIGLRSLFKELGWESIYDFPRSHVHQTAYGPIKFDDGVQTWINPHLNAPS